METPPLDVIAVYYPHWHKYPKGIEWFGDAWKESEWAYVKNPITRFKGHINFAPLGGYYDSSNPEDMETEIALASNAGLTVFLYDYYWYDGQHTQEEAIEKGFLGAKNRNRMSFALMWCYHERADQFRPEYGKPRRRLMSLAHTPEEFLGLIDYSIAHYFNQPEYWRKDGKLFFSIYNLPYLWQKWGEDDDKVRNALEEARRRVRAANLGEMHFNAQGVPKDMLVRMATLGIDSFTEYNFSPSRLKDAEKRIANKDIIFDYSEYDGQLQARWKEMREASPVPFIPTVTTGWDSTQRCREDVPFPWPNGLEYPYTPTTVNNTDALLEKYLRDAKDAALADPMKPGAVYINAWNEYTEGCWLLPDKRWSDTRLRAVAHVFGRHPANEYVFTPYYRPWEEHPINQKAITLPMPDVENLKYGPHPRQGIDVWLPKGTTGKSPMLIIIHGGGWNLGDRLKDVPTWLEPCLNAGIALATANYRFIQDAKDADIIPPVKACMDDAEAIVQTILNNAERWNLDTSRIGLTGGSAGACSCLYAGLKDGNAFGIRALYILNPQTSLDPAEMRAWIPNSTYGSHAFGYASFQDWFDHRDESLPWIEAYSGAALLRKCPAEKAPAFMHAGNPLPPEGQLPPDPTHAAAFRFRFQELCEAKGIFCKEGTHAEFLKLLLS